MTSVKKSQKSSAESAVSISRGRTSFPKNIISSDAEFVNPEKDIFRSLPLSAQVFYSGKSACRTENGISPFSVKFEI